MATTVFSYGGRPGTYIEIIKGVGKDIDYMLPYSSDFSFATSQKTMKPVEELYKFINDVVKTVGGNSTKVAAVSELSNRVQELFGFRLFNKLYYAQAWAGSEPTALSIVLPFMIGGLDVWRGSVEVLDPINNLLNATLPVDTGVLLTAPMPNGLSVFTDYTAQVINGVSELKGVASSAIGAALGGAEATLRGLTTTEKWTIKIGLFDAESKTLTPFIVLNDLIVKSASPTYNLSSLDTEGKPTKGSITLGLETQSIPVVGFTGGL